MTHRDQGYESLADWSRDLHAKVGNAHREYLRDYRPEYDDVPPEVIPWPWRAADVAEPTHCPKCGRGLIHYWWNGDDVEVGYHEVACAGVLQPLLRLRPGWLFFIHHWQITLGENDRRKRRRWRFDPMSGEPMDGPR